MTDTLPLSIQPVISYPKEVEVGKTYLMEIDLYIPKFGFEWQYEEEEYLIYCMVNAGNLFTVTSVGEPAIVLHRFGGTYGNAKFLLEAGQEEREGEIKITLVNNWGVPIKLINLTEIQVIEKLADLQVLTPIEIVRQQNVSRSDINSLVQEVKQKIAADVTERCGTMRVLDMTQPVDLDRIYTDVNIIKEVIGRRRIGYDEVMEVCTREHFDRFLVGAIKERVTGFAAVEEFQKLVVLGKPGAGKTTFMKYLAMSCLDGRFHLELVPIFVTLKVYAEEKGQPSLENYILREFQKREVGLDVVERLLMEGRALILLDGLDEVKKEDDRRVKQDIDQFSRDWLKNRFAITCRIAVREYQFEKFTEVEVADFDDEQIKAFVNNWFWEKDNSKAELMLEKLKDDKSLRELAKSTLLLMFLCLVFEELNDFPPKRSELYREGLEVLMKKWDAKRNIEREMIYKHLSPQNKEDMLGQIAFNTFVNGEYFFRRENLQRQIKDYICKLPEASADPDVLRLDSEFVLKAIEHHNGLLVERARNIYSFSHLVFQEYFTAWEIERESHFEILVENISNPRWKEVFYLTAEMLRRSDDFLLLMENHIDRILANDEKLQSFLEWANHKTNSVQFSYKSAAVRAFYAGIGFDINVDKLLSQLFFASSDIHHITSVRERTSNIARNIAKTLDLKAPLDFDLRLDSYLRSFLWGVQSITDTRNRDNELEINFKREGGRELNLDPILELKLESLGDDILQQALQGLNDRLPDDHFYQWWDDHSWMWVPELLQVCIDRRNIGHNWQFTKEQVELLEKYYAANLLLVECMNRSYVSKQVREDIESNMLLPSKKRKGNNM